MRALLLAALALAACGDNLRVTQPDAPLPSCSALPECMDEIPTTYCTHGGECFCHGVACERSDS